MALTLMGQWLNSSLPTQGPWVQTLVKELDPAMPQPRPGAAKQVS